MPHVVTPFRMSRTINFYFNVTRAVGAGRPNDTEDVLLVQFLLNLVVAPDGSRYIQPPLDLTGSFDARTGEAIRAFQGAWNRGPGRRRHPVAQDGVVSPGQGLRIGDGDRTWTILALNVIAATSVTPARFTDLSGHPDCPAALRALFAQSPRESPPPPTPAALVSPRLAHALGNPAGGGGGAAAALGNPSEGAAGLTAPLPAGHRRYNPSDPAVLWAARTLAPGRSLFSDAEWSEIMETVEGTGDWTEAERWTLVVQIVELIFGEPYLNGMSIPDAQRIMAQDVELGGYPRLPRRR